MKGFIASVLAMVPSALACKLAHPIHLAFSYDEEIGCVGVRRMIDMLESTSHRPRFCIIGDSALFKGHKPDEYILKLELERCDQFLSDLLVQLTETALCVE
ncbi:M20/M25/M40 family metallo-hydrolase [Candidatus Spongiihabitans sp.]|uniref:M20/M25/M40 family metallo-hydrolase n=1 Tax=Candidatus Spongiihabitans sp. TaxID=3101308 RepID=UPI003C6F580D